MKFATVCSGIGAPEQAWHPMGWKSVFFSEIESFPNAVLKETYPTVPNLGDMTKYKEWPDYDLTDGVICAGTPCQSFSLAGLRKGLDDPRGNLTLVYLGILRRYRPRWMVWENVPGVLSDKTGAFGAFLGGLEQLGYGFAYRILDAQYIGVPQRRRRVFVVGYFGDWRRAAAVLFERHSLQGHTPPSRKAGKGFAADVAPSLTESGRGVERCGESRGQDQVIAFGGNNTSGLIDVSTACNAKGGSGRMDFESETLLTCFHGTQDPCVSDIAFAQGRNNGQENVIAFAQNQRNEVRLMEVAVALAAEPGSKQQIYCLQSVNCPRQRKQNGIGISDADVMYSCTARDLHGIQMGMQVRRLTPRECERLQGFPDDATLIPWKGKPKESCPDGPRYKAIGNSMAVPCLKWLGERIEMVESI